MGIGSNYSFDYNIDWSRQQKMQRQLLNIAIKERFVRKDQLEIRKDVSFLQKKYADIKRKIDDLRSGMPERIEKIHPKNNDWENFFTNFITTISAVVIIATIVALIALPLILL